VSARLSLVLALAAGCSAETKLPAETEPNASPTDPTVPPSTAVPTTTGPSDFARVEALLAGEGRVESVLAEVGRSGGFPVREGDDVIFLREGSAPFSVAGDFDGWTGTPMEAGEGFRWLRVAIPEPLGQGYKFTDGAAWEADPWARAYAYDAYGELSYVAPPTDRAHLERIRGFSGSYDRVHTLFVWVPAGEGPWPTLYAHDGQNLFDPGAIWGGWRLQEALEARAPVLVVGIDNTPDRFEEYTHVPDDVGYGGTMGGDGDRYAAFVEEDVRPLVEARYGAHELVGTFGSSLGGLESLVIAQDYPGRYDFVASLSGTLGWGRFALSEETIAERWLADPPADVVVYVDSGGGPGDDGACVDVDGDGFSEDDPDASDNYCETRQFADALAGAGFVWDETLFHWWTPGATHDELAWSQRIGGALDRFLALDR
jgi:predicted alpha/beta superfamily hydrolase